MSSHEPESAPVTLIPQALYNEMSEPRPSKYQLYTVLAPLLAILAALGFLSLIVIASILGQIPHLIIIMFPLSLFSALCLILSIKYYRMVKP